MTPPSARGSSSSTPQFTTEQKIRIAQALDDFGVEYLELTSPQASPGSLDDLRTIAGLGLNARILTHIRCHREDAKVALDSGRGRAWTW